MNDCALLIDNLVDESGKSLILGAVLQALVGDMAVIDEVCLFGHGSASPVSGAPTRRLTGRWSK